MTGWDDLEAYSDPFRDDLLEDPFTDEPAGAQAVGLEPGGAFDDPFSDDPSPFDDPFSDGPGDGGARTEAPERALNSPHSASGAGEDSSTSRTPGSRPSRSPSSAT